MYETRLDKFTWYMDRDEVLLSQEKLLPEKRQDRKHIFEKN